MQGVCAGISCRIGNGTYPYVTHFDCVEQSSPSLCGFHALFNGINFLHVLFADDNATKLRYAHKLKSPVR